MKVHIATDHAGFELKNFLATELSNSGYIVIDHGAFSFDSDDDYPPFCFDCSNAVIKDQKNNEKSLGIVIGGSGNGEQIAANKVHGIRAVLAWSKEIAVLARQHNNANVVSIGARFTNNKEALNIVLSFLKTPFSNEKRHIKRIDMLEK